MRADPMWKFIKNLTSRVTSHLEYSTVNIQTNLAIIKGYENGPVDW